MRLRQLRYFLAVAKTGSQTSAAQKLNVSQPALGLQVRELEAKLGVSLFVRRSRGMELTEAGRELQDRAEKILQDIESARHAMRAYSNNPTRRITLGTPPTPGKLLVPPLLRALADQKALTLGLQEGLSSDLAIMIKNGDLDLALTYDPSSDLKRSSAILAYDDLILIGPPHSLGGGRKEVSFGALGKFLLVMDSPKQITRKLLDKLADQEDVSLKVALEVDSVNLKREVILSHGCFAIVPRGLFSEAITEGRFDWAPIIKPSITRTLFLIGRSTLPNQDFQVILDALRPIVSTYIRDKNVNWRLPQDTGIS